MSIHPCLEEITRKQWGNNGIICTDGGALKPVSYTHLLADEKKAEGLLCLPQDGRLQRMVIP